MGHTSEKVMERWLAHVSGRSVRRIESHNVWYDGDTIYSYGTHFPLARALFDKKGKLSSLLLNGDTFSPTTNRHQADMRSVAHRSGLPYVVIPISAINAAGINYRTITILEGLGERWTNIPHYEPEPPAGSYTTSDGRMYTSGAERITVVDQPDGSHWYQWQTRRHWLGESLIEATVEQSWSTRCKVCDGMGQVNMGPAPIDHSDALCLSPDGYWDMRRDYQQARHRWSTSGDPCESCRWGQINHHSKRRRKFLSGFDRNEKRPSYFFCELPVTKAKTVEDAYEALKPDTVRIAEQMGRPVKRQGDIFAVAMSTLDKRRLSKLGATYAKRGSLFGTNHVATETATLPDGRLFARGCLTHAPEGRTADHARVKLDGRGWYLVVKNTVPLTK